MAAIVAILGYVNREPRADNPGVKPHWVLIGSVVLICSTFSLPILLNLSTSNLLHYSAFGYDDAAHIQMYRADISVEGYVSKVDKTDQPDLNIDSPVTSYPQGLHFNLSLFGRSIFDLTNKTLDDVRLLIGIYRIGMILIYAALLILLAEIIAQSVAYLRQKQEKLGLVTQLGMSATLFIIFNTLIFPQIAFAGQSFLTTVAALCGTLLGLIIYHKTTDRLVRYIAFGSASLFAVAAAYTWILTVIVALTALVAAAWGNKVVLDRSSRVFTSNWQWWFIGAALVLSLPQVLILLFDTHTGVNSLTNDGGIASPDHGRYLVLILGVLLTMLLAGIRKKTAKDSKRLFDIGIVLTSPLVLVLFFYAVQTVLTGQLSYYYTKSTYLGYIILLGAIGVALTYLLSKVEIFVGLVKTLYLTVVVFGVLAMYLSVGRGFLVYAKGTNTNVQKPLTTEAGHLIDSGVRPRNIISYTGRSYEEDMFFNLVTDMLDQYRPENRHTIAILAQQKRYEVFKQFIGDYSRRDERTYILVSEQTQNEMRKALPADGNYEVIVIK
ncbi:MAG TPA: hypothetical protein VFT16_02040 [Candidatus Saccharimonadales bacterium]|nr:hypothetical protein [Candidatus Saccharimonadales bacterium]